MFLATLALFALITRFVFSAVFFQNAYQEDLMAQTEDAAARVQACFAQPGFEEAFANKDLARCGQALSFLRDYATVQYAEIWVVADETVLLSYNQEKGALEFDEIPSRYHPMVEEIFSGQDVSNREYSGIWNRNRFGVGAPVTNGDGKVVAAVITQVSTAHVASTVRSADTAVLWSSAVAFVAALGLAGLLTGFLTNPLLKMKAAAEVWMTGDYTARTGVSRGDEIGLLADTMDVLAGRLDTLKSEREQSEQARYQFFADVSHELKTPLTVLRAQLEMLEDGLAATPEEQKVCLNEAKAETLQMQRLVEDLLTLAKLQSPEFALKKEPVSLADVLGDVYRGTRPRALAQGVALSVENRCPQGDAALVLGDYGRIRQMIHILLDNSFKATSEGAAIRLRLAREGDNAVITVADQGRGMTGEELAQVFQRYYTHYAPTGGSGLGLPIAKEIAARHGAELTMESAPGKGATATIRFPKEKMRAGEPGGEED